MKQLIRWKMGRRISLAMTAMVAAGALAMSGPAAAEVSGTVTSVKGDTSVGAKPAEIASLVSEGESIVTGPEGACSLLVDKRSLVQFCGQAAVRLSYDEERGATIVNVTEGTTRALVGPRAADEPLEIHTPVAIAAILGTILSVEVDPVTGDSTFALEQGKVQIRTQTSDPTRSRTITLNAGEQVTVHKDGIADEVQRLELQDVAGRADCMNDLHAAPIWIARADREEEVTEKITGLDIADMGLPPVAAPPPGDLADLDRPIDQWGENPGDIVGVVDIEPPVDGPGTRTVDPPEPPRSRRPPPCTGGIPGEHCF
jgi:hypothetical protein